MKVQKTQNIQNNPGQKEYWGHAFKSLTWSCNLLSASWTVFATCFHHHDVVPYCGSRDMEPGNHRPQKPWDKISDSYFKLFLSVIEVTVTQKQYTEHLIFGGRELLFFFF
jgi:hypothetical protein